MMQQGNFSADVLYYYGDHVPNFAQLKQSDPAHIHPGYDYDVITEEALIERASVRDGRLCLPEGTSYRLLVLPSREVISLPVLRKIRELVAAGATVVGPKPVKGETLTDEGNTDAEISRLADELWGGHVPGGRVIADRGARAVLLADGVSPDCVGAAADLPLDYLHRTADGAEIYFVACRTNSAESVAVTFRVADKVPELWNAVTGERQFARAYTQQNGCTTVPLEFDPYGSWVVVFREPAAQHPAVASSNRGEFIPAGGITGPWTVHFDPQWGGPASVQFATLTSWTDRPEPGIKYYSGTAVYEKEFVRTKPAAANDRVYLDLGSLSELAEVKVNGQSCGVSWCPPWRVEVTGALRPGANRLQVEVVNFWPNRIIGDAMLPPAGRITRTNIRKLTAKTALEPSGLFGPVQLLTSPVP